MESKYYVYIYSDPRTDIPFYVGKGSGDRYLKHLYENYNNTENKKKYAVIVGLHNKGIEPAINIVKYFDDEVEAYEYEESLIRYYGRRDIDDNGVLTNICSDNRPPSAKGRSNTPSKETRQIWSKQRKGKPSPHKGKKRPELQGNNNGFYGKEHSEETRKLMSDKRKQRVKSGEGEGRSGMLGKNHTEATKEKLRKANIKQFEDNSQRELRSEKSKELWNDPKWREKYKGNTGKKRYNNGVDEKLLGPEDEIPKGFVIGAVPRITYYNTQTKKYCRLRATDDIPEHCVQKNKL